MFHPYPENVLKLTILSDLNIMIVTYKGHATPLYQLHPGKDAAVLAYANISVLGQPLKHDIYSPT